MLVNKSDLHARTEEEDDDNKDDDVQDQDFLIGGPEDRRPESDRDGNATGE